MDKVVEQPTPTEVIDDNIPLDELISIMDDMIDNDNHEIKLTADNIDEYTAEVSEAVKVEDTTISVTTEADTDTTATDGKEDGVNVTADTEAEESGVSETGTEPIVEGEPTSHSEAEVIVDKVSDKVTIEESTVPNNDYYEKLLQTMSKVSGTEVTEITPDMITKMYQSAKGLNKVTGKTVEQAMIDKHKISPDDLAMLAELKAGNVDVVKKFMVDNDINPFEVNLEEFNDDALKGKLSDNSINPIELKLSGFIDQAESNGVKEVVVGKVLSWDESSVLELLDDTETGSTLLSQIKDGSFDKVMAEVDRLSAMDFTDNPNESMLDKYSRASYSLANKRAKEMQEAIAATNASLPSKEIVIEKTTPIKKPVVNTPLIDEPNSDVVPVEDNDDRIKAARVASSTGNSITGTGQTTKKGGDLDINNMSVEDLHAYMDSMIQ